MECERQGAATPSVVHSICIVAFQNRCNVVVDDVSLLENAQDGLHSSLFGEVSAGAKAKDVFVTLRL